MSDFLAQLKAQADLAAQTGPDMTEAQKGGGGARLLPEGYAFARLVEYIEYGSQPQEFGGVAKDPAPEFQLGFALSGFAPNPDPAGQPLPYANDDGTPYIMRTWSMAMSRNDKARAFLLFKAMNYKGKATHFAQLLGEGFLVKISTVKGKAVDAKPRSSIDLKDIRPPFQANPVTGAVDHYPIPVADDKLYKLFLWEHPTLEAWKSLFIEGEFEAKDGKPALSKNFVQNDILAALDFSGSALELLLKTSGTPFVMPPKKAAAAAPAAPATPAAAPVTPASPVVAPAVVVATPVAVAPVVPATAPNPPFDGGTPVVAPVAAPVVVAPVAVAKPAMPAMPVMPA